MKMRQICCLSLFSWLLIASTAIAKTSPDDVYQRVLSVAAEIDLIRLEMGVSNSIQPDIAITNAQPREVYFQALTLFKKANRLMFEHLREKADLPALHSETLQPDDVLKLVNNTSELLLRIKDKLGITQQVSITPTKKQKNPTDVYKLIVRLNRTLNRLLQQRFAPADVYQQLTYGVGLSAEILGVFTDGERLGEEPPLIRQKTPDDVYQKLIFLYTEIHKIMSLSNLKCLSIEAAEMNRKNVSPSDVYDLASLLISELSYLHKMTPGAGTTRSSYYPGDKLPAHVFQRAGRLESQIRLLHQYVELNPDWLRPQ